MLFRRRQREVYRFALHMTGSAAAAEDVTQDVFLAVMSDARRYEPGRSATSAAWLCGMARNHARRRFERDRGVVALDEDAERRQLENAVYPDPVGDLTRGEGIAAVRKAVLTLPLHYREAVVLCDLHELSYAAAAAALECAVGTVRSRLHRGRVMLGVKLAGAGLVAPGPGTADDSLSKPSGTTPTLKPELTVDSRTQDSRIMKPLFLSPES